MPPAPDTAASGATAPKDSFEKARAYFQACHLHALEPLIRASHSNILRWDTTGLIIEPMESGGAVLVTTDGRSLAAIFDPKASATRSMRLTISDDLFEAVKPAKGVKFFDQGDSFEMPAPEWAQPGDVFAWGLAAFVSGRMPHPSFDKDDGGLLATIRAEDGNCYAGGYRIHEKPPTLDWRKLFDAKQEASAGRLNIYPDLLARFDRIERLFRKGFEVAIGGVQQALFLTIPGHPEFIGAMMPNSTPIETPDLPFWALAAAQHPAPCHLDSKGGA